MNDESTNLEAQNRVAAIVRSIDVAAPPSLHAAVGEMVGKSRSKRPSRWAFRRAPLLLGGAGGLAVAALVLILALGSAGQATPTVLQASALALYPSTQAAPEENPRTPGQLAISAGGIPYPYWGSRFGWQTAGARSDELHGRKVTTVFYTNRSGARIGYAIVTGAALPIPATGHTAVWRGVRFEVLHVAGATVVTWRRAGHTCILLSSKVSARTLLTLAQWQAT
jgi:hypothetical protein